ncbi:MAG: methyltransferase domain-containing protein [Myxococcales bacterium]
MAGKLTDYIANAGAAGLERSKVLARVMQDPTAALFDRVGIAAGSRCLDVGCGTGDVSFELASRVGPRGQVIGADLDPAKLELARRDAELEGLSENLAFQCVDVAEWSDERGFDAVYARFVLTQLRDPAAMLATFVRLTRPGGVVIVEDIDHSGWLCEPPSASHDRYTELCERVVQSKGADVHIGLRLPTLMAEAGLADVRVDVVQPVALRGEAKLAAAVSMKNMADAVVGAQLATAAEVEALAAELIALAERPDTLMGMPRILQIFGRRT